MYVLVCTTLKLAWHTERLLKKCAQLPLWFEQAWPMIYAWCRVHRVYLAGGTYSAAPRHLASCQQIDSRLDAPKCKIHAFSHHCSSFWEWFESWHINLNLVLGKCKLLVPMMLVQAWQIHWKLSKQANRQSRRQSLNNQGLIANMHIPNIHVNVHILRDWQPAKRPSAADVMGRPEVSGAVPDDSFGCIRRSDRPEKVCMALALLLSFWWHWHPCSFEWLRIIEYCCRNTTETSAGMCMCI